MKRTFFLLYGVISYLAFLGTILYAIGFVGNHVVPKTIDGEPRVSLASAIFTNVSLLLLFAMQHSIMARPAFKRWWTRVIPAELEPDRQRDQRRADHRHQPTPPNQPQQRAPHTPHRHV